MRPNLNKKLRHVSIWLIAFLWATIGNTQSLRNNWIDYSKTYYRFPVTPAVAIPNNTSSPLPSNQQQLADYNSLYRISYNTLVASGLQNVPVEQFQLWRNGTQVAVYTYPASGVMGADGYIEFWGLHNDGKTDRDLYRFTNYQSHDRWSMYSDTAWYYLTVNPGGNNLRITDAPNNALSSSLIPDSFFMHTITVSPRTHRNLGNATPISGAEVRSSTFDVGEGWATRRSDAVFSVPFTNLFPFYNTANTLSVRFSMQGASQLTSSITLELNDSAIGTKSYRNYRLDSSTYAGIALSRISPGSNGSCTIDFNSSTSNFTYQLSKIQFTYPRSFKFNNGTSAFVFDLPANSNGNLLKIVSFDNSANPKILIDLTNQRRYTAISVADTLWFELEPSATQRSLVLTTLNTSNNTLVRQVSNLVQRNFINFNDAANQGNYLIISNKRLFNDNGSNRVEEYRSYRSSAAGGGYNAVVYDIDELTEQFAYNILKHPLAIRNFLRFARTTFNTSPKAVFLIGRGATYDYATGATDAEFLNLVPTWGQPASDNLLAADNNENVTPATPVGRLGAITGAEVKAYLEKVKAFEAVQNDPDSYKAWEKKTIHMIGGNDANIVGTLRNYMNSYAATISDTLVGANVSSYERLNNPNTAANNAEIQNAVKDGVGIISYFGHSSAVSIDFNLNNPNELAMTEGRYPLFIANGCKASEFFDLNTLRYNQRRLTLSERFVLPQAKGAIAFLSSTHVGILQYLDRFTSRWYKAASTTQYGKTIGEIHQETIRQMMLSYTTYDQNARLTSEEYHLHGDPAVKLFPLSKPDYIIDSTSVIFNPIEPTAADDSVRYQFTIRNDGKATNDTILVKVSRILPDNSQTIIRTISVPKLGNSQIFGGSFAIRGSRENGRNYLKVEVDYNNKVNESQETNNVAAKSFWIEPKGLKPAVPAQFSIVSNWPIDLIASTNEMKTDSGLFRMEMDTTTLFNSPLLYSLQDSARNGVVRFSPAKTLLPGKVYYWRTAQIVNSTTGTWQTSSFTYRPGDGTGFNQEHFYQHTQSAYRTMQLDSASRRFKFNPKANNLYIVHGVYPTSATEDLQFSVTPNGSSFIYSACLGQSIIFNVFDSLSFAAFKNPAQVSGTVGGCGPGTPGRNYNFEFKYFSIANRKKIMDFMDSVPTGHYVVARLVLDAPHDSSKVAYWKRDTAVYGTGNSVYHRFLKQGFYAIDSMTLPRTFSVVYRQNDTVSFKPQWVMSDGLYDLPVMSADIQMIDTSGTITSPIIGPARSWASMQWRRDPSFVEENGLTTDSIKTYVLGIKSNGSADTLFALNDLQDFSFDGGNAVDARLYPYMKIIQQTNDADNATPVQLNYWRVYFQPAAEGSLAPEELFQFGNQLNGINTDTLQLYRDTLQLKIAFRNISQVDYADSLMVQVQLEDSLGNVKPVTSYKVRALAANDSVNVYASLPLTDQQMVGSRKIRVSVNGQGQQPEVELSNNTLYHDFFVSWDGAIPGYKIYNGTGNWSEDAKWLPAGQPTCTDKVIINGNCTVDIANAVSDTLLVNSTGVLQIIQSSAKLNVGCSEVGGNKLATIKGSLIVSNGTLQLNGGMLIENGANLQQSGGTIILDPNADNTGNSLNVGQSILSSSPSPYATLCIGGPDPVNGAYTLGSAFTAGSVSFSGGTLVFIDPPISPSALSLYWNQAGAGSITYDPAHTTIFGGNQISALNTGSTSPFRVANSTSSPIRQASMGSVIVRTALVPLREVILEGDVAYILWVIGQLLVEENSILRVKATVDLRVNQ